MIFWGKKQEEERIKPLKKRPEDDYEWDKRKIAIFLLVFSVIVISGIELKRVFFPNTKILGVSVQEPAEKPNINPPRLNFSSVNSSISEIKENIESLNAAEVATSSPQIQKVLRDIQGIKDLPTNQAREMCYKVCSGI